MTARLDVVGFNEGSWIDYSGHPHTDLLHVVLTDDFGHPLFGPRQ